MGSAKSRNSVIPLTDRTQERRGKLHHAAVAAENEECTFRPQICAKSRRLVAQRKTELGLRQRASIILQQEGKESEQVPMRYSECPLPSSYIADEELEEPHIPTSRISIAQLRAVLSSSLQNKGPRNRARGNPTTTCIG